MHPKFSVLNTVHGERPINEIDDAHFWRRMQNSLLLALKEQGRLSGLQYQYALEQLRLSSKELPEDTP